MIFTALEPLLTHLDRHDPGELVGVYLYGSASTGTVRPDSDIDVLAVTSRSLDQEERTALVDLLLRTSGWRGHAGTFPEAADRRPIDFTCVVLGGLQPLTPWLSHDFQYGEWHRAELVAGEIPGPAADPDTIVVLATALASHQLLRGAKLRRVLPQIPGDLLRTALVDNAMGLLGEVGDDQRNVLLGLARTLTTIATGTILAKDEAARTVAGELEGSQRQLLLRAREEYLGRQVAERTTGAAAAKALAEELVTRIRRAAGVR